MPIEAMDDEFLSALEDWRDIAPWRHRLESLVGEMRLVTLARLFGAREAANEE